MKLTINGNMIDLPADTDTVADVIAFFQFKSPIIIVEHNDTILKREQHATTNVSDGDTLEFVQFVGGG